MDKKLPDSLILALLTHLYIGWGLLYLAKLSTAHLTHNAYWSILVALLIIAPFLWIVFQLAKSYPGLSISQIFIRVFGKILGGGLFIIYILHIAYFQIIFFRDSQLMVYTYFFKNTPFILMTGLLIAGVLYIAWRGAASIGRLAVFMLLPPFLIILGLQVIGLSNVDPLNIQPVFEGSFANWFFAGTDLVIIMLPGNSLLIWLPFLKKTDSIKKITAYSLAMVLPLFFLNILGIIGTFGLSTIKKMNWPAVEYFHVIDYPFLLLEQMGLFFLIAWYTSIFITLAIGAFVMGNELPKIFPRLKPKLCIVAFCIILWISVNLPISTIASENFFKRTQKIAAFSFLGFIFVTWLVGWFRIRFAKSNR